MSHSRSPDRLSKWPSKFLFFDFYEWNSKCSGLPPQIIDAEFCPALQKRFLTFIALKKGATTISWKLVWLYFGVCVTPVMQNLIGIIQHLKVTTFNVFMQSLSGLRQLANQIWSQPLMNTNRGNEQFGKAARPFVASSPGSASQSRHNEVKLLHT